MTAHSTLETVMMHDVERDFLNVDNSSAQHDLAGGELLGVRSLEARKVEFHRQYYDELAHSSHVVPATEEEINTLRRVSDTLPLGSWLIVVVELCERFAYYGASAPLQNYMQFSPDSHVPGYLGLGQSTASGLSYFFQFFCYSTPIFGAIVADQYIGRYRAIILFAILYVCGLIILTTTSIPSSSAKLPGLIITYLVVGMGTGGIKSNVGPMMANQYTNKVQFCKELKTGERVVVDPSLTIERLFLYFYFAINLGSMSVFATTTLEMAVNFWAAFLLPTCVFLVSIFVIIAGRKAYICNPPTGSIIPKSCRALWVGAKNKFSLDAAKGMCNKDGEPLWDDLFIDELKRALVACRVFTFNPIYWVCQLQIYNNLVSQAGTMRTAGVPNDMINAFDSITILIGIPICDFIVYPLLRRYHILFKPITRIAVGFFFIAAAMIYTCVIQNYIYSTGPYYDTVARNHSFNDVSVWWQMPSYIIVGFSEILASITSLEYAYSKAPTSMKSIVMSLNLLTTGIGSALGIALAPTSQEPKLVWMYGALGVAAFISGTAFWFLFRDYNLHEDEMNNLGVTNHNLAPSFSPAESHSTHKEGVQEEEAIVKKEE